MPSTYTPIATTTLGSASNSVSFSSISGTYTDLVLVGSLNVTAGLDYWVRVNSDSGSNYSNTRIIGNGSTASSARSSNGAQIYINATGTATGQQQFTMNLFNYSNSTTYKTLLIRYDVANQETVARVGLWRNTAAINTILIQTDSSTFTAGSMFTLYGIKAA